MIQSTSHSGGHHVAIIMDGNGRWATEQGFPRGAGHQAGVAAVRRTVTAAPGLGIGILTLFAFSSDNWRRPGEEVGLLMQLFQRFLRSEARTCRRNGVRINVIGRRDRLSPLLARAIPDAEEETREGRRLLLRVAVDYSARDALVSTAGEAAMSSLEAFRGRLAGTIHCVAGAPDVDLLIRTGQERRLSDFLLWELAYAELFFSDVMWPDFTPTHLAEAVKDYRRRERRFGGLPEPPIRLATR